MSRRREDAPRKPALVGAFGFNLEGVGLRTDAARSRPVGEPLGRRAHGALT